MRALGWRGPMLLLEGVLRAARPRAVLAPEPVAHGALRASRSTWLAAHKTQQPHRVFLKMNSGMNRLGFTPQRFRAAWARLNALPQVDEISLMTHFTDADGARGIARQLRGVRARHATTCRASARWPTAPRPCATRRAAGGRLGAARHHGLRQRARLPRRTTRALGPAADHDAALAAHRRCSSCSAGDTVGYGSSFSRRARRCASASSPAATPTATRATAPRGTPVLVDGVRTRTVGRVSMDMITVDLTPVPHAGVGSEVTLWGRGPHGARAADRRGGARRRHRRLRADVRAGAAGARSTSTARNGDAHANHGRTGRGRAAPRSARKARAGRTSTRCRARCTCASTSALRRCPTP